MMSERLLAFIRSHSDDDVDSLRLAYAKKNEELLGFPLEMALIQIEARKKAARKIPNFIKNTLFYFPTLTSVEQATNESVAKFHASLIKKDVHILDMSAGLGIDAMTMAALGFEVTACEIDECKCEALRHNAKIFGLNDRLNVICCDSTEYLKITGDKYDIIFADPSRRTLNGKRVHALSDCTPDICGNLSLILKSTDRLIVKSSPLLDLSLIVETIENLHHIHVVCYRGECKEVLLDIRNGENMTGITVVDLDKDRLISEFHCENPQKSTIIKSNKEKYLTPTDYSYLYEPNAGIMKTGDWETLLKCYPALQKADNNTHIFLSDVFYEYFPGRVLQIESEADRRTLKEMKGEKINIVARNYPMSAQEIFSKFKIKPGNDRYLYAFRYNGKPIMLIGRLKKCEPHSKQDSLMNADFVAMIKKGVFFKSNRE